MKSDIENNVIDVINKTEDYIVQARRYVQVLGFGSEEEVEKFDEFCRMMSNKIERIRSAESIKEIKKDMKLKKIQKDWGDFDD